MGRRLLVSTLTHPGAPLMLATVVAAAVFHAIRAHALLGWDTYPTIAAARIDSLESLGRTLVTPLMGDWGPSLLAFYRPVLAVSLGLDHLLWGLDPKGFHATTAVLMGTSMLALYAMVRSLAPSTSRLAALFAMIAVAVHPAWVEVLAIPCNRHEILCGLFLQVAIVAQLHPWRSEGRRMTTVALATCLAIGAKETAFVAPVLTALAAWLSGARSSDRLRRAARGTIGSAVAVVVMLGVRIVVLGGMGGYSARPIVDPARVPSLLSHLVAEVLAPQPAVQSVAWCAAAAMAVGGTTLVRAEAGRLVGFAGAWIACLAMIYSAVGVVAPWYVAMGLPAWGLLCAGLIAGATERGTARHGRPWARALALTAMLACVVTHLAFTPLMRVYPFLVRATTASDRFLGELRPAIASAGPGTVIETAPLPVFAASEPGEPFGGPISVLAPYSVDAWAALTWPDRRVRVATRSETADELTRDGRTIAVVTRRPGPPA